MRACVCVYESMCVSVLWVSVMTTGAFDPL